MKRSTRLVKKPYKCIQGKCAPDCSICNKPESKEALKALLEQKEYGENPGAFDGSKFRIKGRKQKRGKPQ